MVGWLSGCASDAPDTATVTSARPLPAPAPGEVTDSVHLATGLVYAPGFLEVRGSCTPCHSAKLITQNRATRAGWATMLRWMEEAQGMGSLGVREPVILDYLAKHYAPRPAGRRPGLDVEKIEWYLLGRE